MRPRCFLSGAEVSRETIASAAPSVRRTPQSPLEPQPPTNAHHNLGAEYLAGTSGYQRVRAGTCLAPDGGARGTSQTSGFHHLALRTCLVAGTSGHQEVVAWHGTRGKGHRATTTGAGRRHVQAAKRISSSQAKRPAGNRRSLHFYTKERLATLMKLRWRNDRHWSRLPHPRADTPSVQER
jgi:hypothetical protein